MEKDEILKLLLADTFKSFESLATEKMDAIQTSFEARLDGLKTQLNARISDLTAVVEEKPLVINFGTVESPKKQAIHSAFPKILNIIKSQKRNPKNIMLVGEAGSGKTHLCSMIAESLGLKFYPMSVGLQTTKSDLLGFVNAQGNYVTSPIREAFEKGGVLLLDEFDSAHAGVVTIINSLLANGHCSFPDKIVTKNDHFICLVACNTYGHGANIDYVGRNRLDGATLDRFVVVNVGYDVKLEKILTGNDQWHRIIEKIRSNIKKQGIKMIVSPRASMNGADLLDAGFKIEEVLDMVIFKGASEDTRLKAMQDINLDEYLYYTPVESPVEQTTSSTSEVTEKVQKDAKARYERDLDNVQYYQVRIENGAYKSIKALNNLYHNCSFGVDKFNLHFGNFWCWQFTSSSISDSLYFTTADGGTRHWLTSSTSKDVLRDFVEYISKNEVTVKDGKHDIVFEVLEAGKIKPVKVITMKAGV